MLYVPSPQSLPSGYVTETLFHPQELAKDFSPPFPQDDEMLLKAKEALEKAET